MPRHAEFAGVPTGDCNTGFVQAGSMAREAQSLTIEIGQSAMQLVVPL